MKDLVSETQDPLAPPVGFIESDNGLSIVNDAGDEQFLCSRVRVIAVGSFQNKTGWGRLVEVTDPNGSINRTSIPNKASPSEVAATLQNIGLRLNPSVKSAKTKLLTLISNWDVRSDYHFLNTLGWCDGDFDTFAVTPSEIIGSKPAFHVGGTAQENTIGAAGSLESWKSTVSSACIGNPMLILAVSVALSGPFVRLLDMNSFVVHLRGSSSSGKTTALCAANSVWSSPKAFKTWRTTANALESVAASANDMFLALDDIGEVSGADAFDAAYMLGNGIGKQRSRSQGGLQDAARWNLSCLSTGEISLREKIAEAGKIIKTGQEVRFIDVEADGRQFGVFDVLHDAGSGSELSAKIKQGALQSYGIAGRKLIDSLTKLNSAQRQKMRTAFDNYASLLISRAPNALGGPEERVARTLALIATAGEVSTLWKITGWPKGDAFRAAEVVFEAWLKDRQMPIVQACTELTRYLKPRMHKLGQLKVGTPISDSIGFIDDDFLYLSKVVLPQVFEDSRLASIIRLMSDQRVLIRQGAHMTVKMPRSLPRRERHYKISRKRLSEFSELDLTT